MKQEYARLATSTPPLSSPYFFTTPMTNASGAYRCCLASTHRPARSTGFITPTHLHLALRCPRAGMPNPDGCGTFPGGCPVGAFGDHTLSSAYLRCAEWGDGVTQAGPDSLSIVSRPTDRRMPGRDDSVPPGPGAGPPCGEPLIHSPPR